MFCNESRERKDENARERERKRENVCVCVSTNDPSRLCQPDKRVTFLSEESSTIKIATLQRFQFAMNDSDIVIYTLTQN